MYTTPDEDRSDLFLAGAVYVLGPVVLAMLLRRLPLPGGLQPFVSLLAVIATTVLVPYLLIRYRKERLADYGTNGPRGPVGTGLLASLPVVVAFVIGVTLSGAAPLAGVPLVDAATNGTYVATALQVVRGLCVALLAIYATVKARTAFRSDPRYLRGAMLPLARIVAIIAAATAALLVATAAVGAGSIADAAQYVLAPLGVAGALWLVHRAVPAAQLTSRPTLITPMVIMAIGSLDLIFDAFVIVLGLWHGAMLAAIGLGLAVLLEGRRSVWGPVGLVGGLVLLSPLLG